MERYDLESLIARQQIVDATIRYGIALDTRDWDLMRSCFTAEAVADFGPWGRAEGIEAIIAAARPVMEGMDATQHLIAAHLIELGADRRSARGTCSLVGEHLLVSAAGLSTCTTRGIYRDRFVLDPELGWRIEHLELEVTWREGNVGIFGEALERFAADNQKGSEATK